jgi:molybdopterin-guanine dinucleotide biosynthesis protein B
MRAFAVSGYSGTGKTTLVEQIVRELVEQGYKVVTVKSSMHNIHEEEGTDSWKHRQAGAKATVILGPHSSTVIHDDRRKLQDLMKNIDADYLIIEGMKESAIPKIWCAGEDIEKSESLPSSVKAIISRSAEKTKIKAAVPILLSTEIEKIIEIVKREAIELSELQV